MCTGTMLTEYYVLTAAHCLGEHNFRSLYVVSEETNVSPYTNTNRNFVVKARKHPTHSESVGDIAVIKVKRAMKGNPIPLCTTSLKGGDMVTVSGWGNSDTYIEDKPLQKIETRTLSYEDCVRQVGYIPDNVVCASSYNASKVCFEDSGSPLVHNGEVCGVRSSTSGCDNRGKPDLFVSVSYYRDWIQNQMRQMDSWMR